MPPPKEESDDALTQYVLSPAANFFRLDLFEFSDRDCVDLPNFQPNLRSLCRDSKMLVRRCAKPDKNGDEFASGIHIKLLRF